MRPNEFFFLTRESRLDSFWTWMMSLARYVCVDLTMPIFDSLLRIRWNLFILCSALTDARAALAIIFAMTACWTCWRAKFMGCWFTLLRDREEWFRRSIEAVNIFFFKVLKCKDVISQSHLLVIRFCSFPPSDAYHGFSPNSHWLEIRTHVTSAHVRNSIYYSEKQCVIFIF